MGAGCTHGFDAAFLISETKYPVAPSTSNLAFSDLIIRNHKESTIL